MLEINSYNKYKLNAGLVLHQIEDLGKYWLFNIETGDIFRLNEVSMCILEDLRDGATEENLVMKLLKVYEVEEDLARQDVREILSELLKEKIITEEACK